MGDVKKFDLASLAPASDTTEIEIIEPQSKQGTGIYITVFGKDSDTYKSLVRRQVNKRMRSMQRGGFRGAQITAEENENEALDLLAGCTKSWREGDSERVSFGGQELECNAQNARAVYAKIPVVYEQVDDAIHDRQSFMKR